MGYKWKEDELAVLVADWPDNSATIIANKLGRSRGSVIGMAHRLKLMNKGPDNKRNTAHSKPVRFIPTPEIKPPPVTQVTAPEPPIIDSPVPMLETNASQCKAVIEGQVDKHGLAMMCGKPVAIGQAFSFCPNHLRRFTVRGNTKWAPPPRI